MKQFLPTPSQNQESVHRRMEKAIEHILLIGILSFTLLVCCSCGSTKVATQLVEHTTVDTIYLSTLQYDSIYIYHDRLQTDTILHSPHKGGTEAVLIKDKSIEYRYKLLRDTIYKTRIDSIPYQVTVTEVKEIQRPLTFYDRLTRSVFWLVIGILLCAIVFKLRKVFKR